jgi:uncharacterized protein YdhG (YjbR/CyaY superfamily)
MKANEPLPATVDEYIATFPKKVQVILNRVRRTVRKAAPDAAEKISYRMPAYTQDGVLVYFGGFAEHVGIYPPVSDKALKRELAPYANEKGNVRFRYDEPIPWDLLTRIVESRLEENALKASVKRKKTR